MSLPFIYSGNPTIAVQRTMGGGLVFKKDSLETLGSYRLRGVAPVSGAQ